MDDDRKIGDKTRPYPCSTTTQTMPRAPTDNISARLTKAQTVQDRKRAAWTQRSGG